MTCHDDRQRNAAAVQLFGNLRRRSCCCAAIDDAREQPGRAFGTRRIGGGAGTHGEVDGNGRRHVGFLRQDHDAVVQDRSDGRQTTWLLACGSLPQHYSGEPPPEPGKGSNQPIVRLAGTSACSAAFATSSAVIAAMVEGEELNSPGAAIVAKYPSWWAMLVTLSLSKTSRARSCAFAFVSSADVMPSRATRSSSSSTTDSTDASDVPWVGVADSVYRNGCSVGINEPETEDARPRSTRAR